MTKIINMFGGPGVGKSTTASGLFYCMKKKDMSVEYVSEYAKDITWEGTHSLLENQLHVFSEQFRRQWRLLGKVDYVITDSPILLSYVYFGLYNNTLEKFNSEYVDLSKKYFLETFKQFQNINFIITRKKKYQPSGRIQSYEEAVSLDKEIRCLLFKEELPFSIVDYDSNPEEIYNKIGK